MSIETMNQIQPRLMDVVFEGSVNQKIEENLNAYGSLLEGSGSLGAEDRVLLAKQLGGYAFENVVATSPELIGRELSDDVFVGGVCALSTRESKMMKGRCTIEDPLTAERIYLGAPAEIEEFSDVVTAVQVFETIGLTSNTSAAILEDKLWTDRTVSYFPKGTYPENEIQPILGRKIQARNRSTLQAVDRLRGLLYGAIEPIRAVIDTDILPVLVAGTDKMYADFGLKPIDTSRGMYPYIYAGMYSYVWRDVMRAAGVVGEEQNMYIYEPSKHIGAEGGQYSDISYFKASAVRKAPFMQSNSPAEKVGLIAIMEPFDVNGRRFRDNVPTALMPNSRNFNNFDFGRFPVIPKTANNALPETADFTFLDDLGATTLRNNPAFMWGLMYPPTQKSQDMMQRMLSLSVGCKEKVRLAVQTLDGKARGDKSIEIRGQASVEMKELSEALIAELQSVTNVMFGEENALK